MFKSIKDIHEAMHLFTTVKRKRPNVLFVSKNNKLSFLEMIFNNEPYCDKPIILQNIEDINILGMQVKFTESFDGVDYLRELDNSPNIYDDMYTSTKYYPIPTKYSKFIFEKPKKNEPPIPIPKKKRKIIL